MRRLGRFVLLGCLLPIAGCGVVDSIKSPKYGVYVGTRITQGEPGAPLKPERFAYIGTISEYQARDKYDDPDPYVVRVSSEGPMTPSGLDRPQYMLTG